MSRPSHQPSADAVYLFRHALVRDAAYDLQPPAERAALHFHALQLLRAVHEDPADPAAILPWAEDMLPHARGARDAEGIDRDELRRTELALTYAAGCHAFIRFENDKALELLGLVQDAPEAAPRSRIGAALRRGGIHHWMARHNESIACREAALKLAREAGNDQLEAVALAHLATSLLGSERAGEVEGLYRRALEIERGQDFPLQLAATLGNLAQELSRQGRHDEAGECHREALEIFRDLGAVENEAIITCNLGQLNVIQGRLDGAEVLLERALQLSREAGARRAEGTTLGQLAALALERGDADRTEELLRQALAIHDEVGNRLNIASDLVTRAKLREHQKRTAEAIEDYRAAAIIQREAGWEAMAREAEQAANALRD